MGLAKRRESSICSSDRTLIVKCEAERKASVLPLLVRRDQSRSGGSSEPTLNELAVRPTGLPVLVTVDATVTPVGKALSACRRVTSCDVAERAVDSTLVMTNLLHINTIRTGIASLRQVDSITVSLFDIS